MIRKYIKVRVRSKEVGQKLELGDILDLHSEKVSEYNMESRLGMVAVGESVHSR